MGTFSAAVASLLDTYSKCLSLLTTFRGSRSGGDADTNVPFANLQPSLLGTSLRSDQASIREAYSSRLSQNGARFEKGDGEFILSSCICKKKTRLPRASKNECLSSAASRSALKRIVRKLAAALAEVIRSLEGSESPAIDYNSLLALSHGSSLDAVRTIEDLSSRVSSKASTSSSSRRSVVSRGRPRSRRHHRQSGDKMEKRTTNKQSAAKSNSKRKKSKTKKSPSESSNRNRRRRRHPSSLSRHAGDGAVYEKRVSIFTISSDSTKLGEIRRRDSRPWIGSAKATYPLYAYPLDEGKRQKKWWKLF
ncbi:hypothetical protein B0T10DRAFT_459731 [Thelonectria olida]|uniref:Uncharacterized protein n=1 Tax=Thelonectria olida TaxID=1576542 RepID=A0A9P8W5Y2_9HYPO|nr:hypothetical protein B0T10DRAFT_459731 [Thelonectria olida]